MTIASERGFLIVPIRFVQIIENQITKRRTREIRDHFFQKLTFTFHNMQRLFKPVVCMGNTNYYHKCSDCSYVKMFNEFS